MVEEVISLVAIAVVFVPEMSDGGTCRSRIVVMSSME